MRKFMLIAVVMLAGCEPDHGRYLERMADGALDAAPKKEECRLICVRQNNGICQTFVVTDECFMKLRRE